MKNLNEYFDKIYCINLDRREDRWRKCSTLFEKNNIIVDRFSAIDKQDIKNESILNSGQLACLLSHLDILNIALEKGYEKILVFEDDVVFDEDINNFFKNNIQDVPDDWKFLYFGGAHLNGLNLFKNNVFKTTGTLTTHAYAIKCDIIAKIIPSISQTEFPVDVYYANVHNEFPSYVFRNDNKTIAWQDDDYSDIDDKKCSYYWIK
jgi:GR25 family glycosyltransferase involved in LPS biosynthesis